MTRDKPYPTDLYPGCPCYSCDSKAWVKTGSFLDRFAPRMSLCPRCGSKRCRGAYDHASAEEKGCNGD
jgi:hypothetical protein